MIPVVSCGAAGAAREDLHQDVEGLPLGPHHPHHALRGRRGQGEQLLVLQKVASELHPKVRNHGEGPY